MRAVHDPFHALPILLPQRSALAMTPSLHSWSRRCWRRAALALVLASICVPVVAAAQDKASDAVTRDPREGLKSGEHAERGLSLVAKVPNPPGFVDPQSPAGPGLTLRDTPPPNPGYPKYRPGSLAFINTDLAFSGDLMAMGNYNGFLLYNIANPTAPKLVSAVACVGGEDDVSFYGKLLFVSVEERRARVDCGMGDATAPDAAGRFRGIRIFDMSDPKSPKQVGAVQTCQGSHTHTLVPDPRDRNTLYIYNSSVNGVRPPSELARCVDKPAKEDQNSSLYSIDVIKVPLDRPQDAKVIASPRVFADPKTGRIDGLTEGGDRGPDAIWSWPAFVCHDITVYPAKGLAGGACVGAGLLLDISDPANPRRIDWVTDKNFGTWHSATFSNDGTKLLFADEWQSGTAPHCSPGEPRYWGGDGVWAINGRKLEVKGYYKIPPVQTELENCVSHNGNLVPVPGRDILVQAWYQGGISLVDFTDPAHPVEIAFYDEGPALPDRPVLTGAFSAYWYNGRIYVSDVSHGFSVFKLEPSAVLSANEIAAAELVRRTQENPQTQEVIDWPRSPVVARAYLDQLARSGGLAAADRDAVAAALDRGTAAPPLARRLTGQAARASQADAARLRGIAAILAR